MTTRTLLLTVHIAAVAGWLGANFVQLVLSPRFDKIGGDAARHWTEATVFLGQRYYAAMGAVLAVTGVLLVLDSDDVYTFGSGFVGVGIAVVIVGAVMGVAIFAPLAKKRVAALTAGDGSAAKNALNRIVGFGLLDTALIAFALLTMVHKWRP